MKKLLLVFTLISFNNIATAKPSSDRGLSYGSITLRKALVAGVGGLAIFTNRNLHKKPAITKEMLENTQIPKGSFYQDGMGGKVRIMANTPESAIIEFHLPPSFSTPASEYHPTTSEHIVVTKGKVMIKIEDQENVLESGDTIDIAAGLPHRISNLDSNEPAIIRITTTPGTGNANILGSIFNAMYFSSNPLLGSLKVAKVLQMYPEAIRYEQPGEAIFKTMAFVGDLLGIEVSPCEPQTILSTSSLN